MESKDKYILILNLRCVIKQNDSCYQIRPGLLKLVEQLKKHFMIVLISNKDHKIADYILTEIGEQLRIIDLDYQSHNVNMSNYTFKVL